MKFGVIIAARTGSTRLPGKALLPLKGLPMIVFLIRRICLSRNADQIVFATTSLSEDDHLAETVAAEKIAVFRGANEDVVKRYVNAADKYAMEYVIRVTGDCPFVDGETLDYCIEQCRSVKSFDLATTKGFFPKGIDYEIYDASVMKHLHYKCSMTSEDREHLIKYIYDHPANFRIQRIVPPDRWNWHNKKFMVDTQDDYDAAQRLINNFDTINFSIENLIQSAEA